MVFLSICTALYDYIPRVDGELAIRAGDIVYVLEKSVEDDWWKAKKKASGDNDDEPIGLIPNNYVEEARPITHARALYDYSRQTDEELSFLEESSLVVYDTSDPEWTLVGCKGEYGFAPANYIELTEKPKESVDKQIATIPDLPSRSIEDSHEEPSKVTELPNPAGSLADIIGKQAHAETKDHSSKSLLPAPENDDTSPTLPERPMSQDSSSLITRLQISPPAVEPQGILASPPINRVARSNGNAEQASQGGFHLYNVNEMVSIMGKQKKMPTTLGINLASGVILIIPEKKRDGPQQEWTAEKLVHYSIEGKHIFMELVKPSKSIDFHAGAKDTAAEIVASLGELAGASRAEGLREVIAAGSGGSKHGKMLYEFMAQGDDEVTVADGDDVIILDDTQSEEWWKVKRVKNGREGVVPSSYVEIVRLPSPKLQTISSSPAVLKKSNVEQNRLDEERIAQKSVQDSIKAARRQEEQDIAQMREVGPGLKLPNRASSLVTGQQNNNMSSQRGKRESRVEARAHASKSKPDSSKTREWTDRSGSFKVEAQFIGLRDGKIHLHKTNGVKIAVPVAKMSTTDLEFVEGETGRSLDEDKPLSHLVKRSSRNSTSKTSSPKTGQPPVQSSKSDYDWFDFFLKCGVSPYQCERYSYNFNKDSMDESILSDITSNVLRNLGLKEGDVIRVMKYLDNKYGRVTNKQKQRNVSFAEEKLSNGERTENDGNISGGIFSGPGGALKNNTRKGRPSPTVPTNDVVNAKALRSPADRSSGDEELSPIRGESPDSPGPVPPQKDTAGFDDNAWEPKTQVSASTSKASPSTSLSAEQKLSTQLQPVPTLTGSMADLSLLSQPLRPIIAHDSAKQTGLQQNATSGLLNEQQQRPQHLLPRQQSTVPQFSDQSEQYIAPAQPQPQPQSQSQSQLQPMSNELMNSSKSQINASYRQRPIPPQSLNQSGLLPPPPPTRPLSAPQNVNTQNAFGPPPLQPQLTGVFGINGSQNQPLIQNSSGAGQNPAQVYLQFQPTSQQQSTTSYLGQSQQSVPFLNTSAQQPTGFGMSQPLNPQITGILPSQYTSNNHQSGPFYTNSIQPQATGISQLYSNLGNHGVSVGPQGSTNSILSAPLQPQYLTTSGLSQGSLRVSGGNVHNLHSGQQNPPPIPPLPLTQVLAPLQPQKTGPAPAVKFGVGQTKKLAAQPTGRRANITQATPENPFGF